LDLVALQNGLDERASRSPRPESPFRRSR
jgi:hypothetical protein